MESLAKDLVALLQYLLPGFVAAWIFYSFTSFPKPSQFERVVQALIFTLFIQVAVGLLERSLLLIGKAFKFGIWNESTELTYSVIFALILGVGSSYFSNTDTLHRLFRWLRITKETSYASEWFSAFLDATFVVLHLKDERRLYGWPIEWPSDPKKGHFLIADPSWITPENSEQRICGVQNILINVDNVLWVEFLEKTWENNNEQEGI